MDELRRRGVFNAAAVYVAFTWGGTEILAFLVQALGSDSAADVASRYLAIFFISGFPVAMYLAWSRDLGLKIRRLIGAAALAIVLVAVLVWLLPQEDPKGRRTVSIAGPTHAVAVLPLQNLSGDPGQEYFSDGMTEALIANLSRLGSLRVISRTSVLRYKGTNRALPEIARELGVDRIVEGSVLRAGDKVRVTAQLIDATSDHHLWANSFERDMTDVLTLQQDIAKEIALAVGAKLSGRAKASQPRQVDPDAYDAFLQAQMLHLKASGDSQAAIRAYERAIELDSSFAPAYAQLADLHSYLALVSGVSAGDAYIQAHSLALRAIELDPDLPLARAVLGRIQMQFQWNWPAAEAALQLALELDSNDATALSVYGYYLVLIAGDCERGLEHIRRARNRDPFNPGLHFDLGVYTFHCRRFDESIRHLTRTGELAPEFFRARLILAWNLVQKGRLERATEQCDKLLREAAQRFEPMVTSSCAWVYGKAGQTQIAEELLRNLRKPPSAEHVDPSWLIAPCIALGKRDCALQATEAAFAQRSSNMMFLRIAVQWDPLRGDRRFEDIVAQMNFPD